MLRLRTPILVGALALLWAGAASAVPVIFTFESSTTFDAGFPSTQTFDPTLPIVGSGDIDEAAGTYSVSLPDFDITLDILALPGDDALLSTTNWSQTGTFAGGVGGALTSSGSTGTTTCSDLGGGLGGLVCADFPAPVEAWPPTGDPGATLGAPGAWIDIGTNTITVNSAFDANGGQIQSIYSYSIVPEPGTVLLLGSGLLGLALTGRRRA